MEGCCHREGGRKVTLIGCAVQECRLLLDIHGLSKQQSKARVARSMITSTWYGTARTSTVQHGTDGSVYQQCGKVSTTR